MVTIRCTDRTGTCMAGEFCFREHKSGVSTVLAVCDAELLGKALKYGDVDFEVDISFYGEERADAEQIMDMAERSHVMNVVGEKIVSLLAENGIIDRKSALMLGNVPHIQVMMR